MSDIINYESPRFSTPSRLRGAASIKGSASVELAATLANLLHAAKAKGKSVAPADLAEEVSVRLGSLAAYYDSECVKAGVPQADLADMVPACVMRDLFHPACAHAQGEKGKESQEAAVRLLADLKAELAILIRAVHALGAEERERALRAQEAAKAADKAKREAQKKAAAEVVMLKSMMQAPGLAGEVLAFFKARLADAEARASAK